MNLFSVRSVCTLASFVCLVVAFLIGAYLSATTGDWLTSEHVVLKLAGGTALAFSVYFGSSAACRRLLWIQLFRNKKVLCTLGAIATMTSVLCFVLILPRLGQMRAGWSLQLIPLLLSTSVAAICIKAGTGWRVFGILSFVFSLPLGLLSIGPLIFTLFPPPPDPVGGNGINAGMVMMLMIPFAINALPAWVASMLFERWRLAWLIFIGLLCLPGLVLLASLIPQLVG